MTIRKKFLIILIAFSIIPVLFISIILSSASIRTIENLHYDRIKAMAHTSATAFTEIVNLRSDEVSMLASSWPIHDYLYAKTHLDTSDDRLKTATASVNTYFQTYINSLTTFDDIVLLDNSGTVQVSYHPEIIGADVSEYDYFTRLSENQSEDFVFISKVHDSLSHPGDTDQRCLALSKALWDSSGNFEGALVAFINVNIIAEFSKSITFGKTGLAFVVDTDGYILYHPESRFYNSYVSAPKLVNLFSLWKQGQIPDFGSIDDVMDGVRRIYFYEVMPDIELVLILRQNYSEFSADHNLAIAVACASAFIVTILSILFGSRFSRRLTEPIHTLKNAFASGSESGAYIQCELSVNDELSDMAESYNQMIKKLEYQYELLKQEKDKNEYNALHDNITNLYNRTAFEHMISGKITKGAPFGVFYVDLDNFKHINDVLGHPAGDAVLRRFGELVLKSEADFDICAYVGGDEFVLSKDGHAKDMHQAAHLLLSELQETFYIGDTSLLVSVSIGISVFPDHGQFVSDLITNADIAMYKIKEISKNSYALYSKEMRNVLDRHNQILSILQECIKNQEVFFMYQPLFDKKDGKIFSFEALMRINSSHLGILSPVEFIPIAEADRALSVRLGVWALNEACRFIKKIKNEYDFDGYISINVSSAHLSQDDFVSDVLRTLDEHEMPACCLQLNITETASLGTLENHIQKLSALREFGVLIALDNFGSHSSWFYYLQHLPLNAIKLGRQFFFGIQYDLRIETLTKSIIDLAHKLDLMVIAEGVETEDEYNALKALECDLTQGFYLNRPLMEENAIQTIIRNSDKIS